MAILVRFLSGSLDGREFTFDRDVIRIGDAEDADLPVNPEGPGDAGARDRVIEVLRDGNTFRVMSIGNRELSAQGDTTIDRRVEAGEEIRFGAWGPVFAVYVAEAGRGRMGTTSPVSLDETSPSGSRKRKIVFQTPSGETPVGPKTVFMMIQDALGRARETDAGVMERGTVFVRNMITQTLERSTRSLKIGLALMGGALVILSFVLFSSMSKMRQAARIAAVTADQKVQGVKEELGKEVDALKEERSRLQSESQSLTEQLGQVEKPASGGQVAVGELRKPHRREDRRKGLEVWLTRPWPRWTRTAPRWRPSASASLASGPSPRPRGGGPKPPPPRLLRLPLTKRPLPEPATVRPAQTPPSGS
jgi:hypothetical protein